MCAAPSAAPPPGPCALTCHFSHSFPVYGLELFFFCKDYLSHLHFFIHPVTCLYQCEMLVLFSGQRWCLRVAKPSVGQREGSDEEECGCWKQSARGWAKSLTRPARTRAREGRSWQRPEGHSVLKNRDKANLGGLIFDVRREFPC